MELLKKSVTILLLIIAVNTQAQDKAIMNAFAKSYELEAGKKYYDAVSTLKAVYDAKSYETNLRLGWLCYLAGEKNESVSYYKIAISLMPAATEPIWGILNPLVVMGQWKEVEKYYLAILNLDPNNSVAKWKLGLIYYSNKDYENVLKMDPMNSLANYRLGLMFYYKKDYTNAKKYFDVSLALYPFDYYNMLMSAWNNYYLGNKKEARILFNKTLLYSPNDSSALEGLGLLK